MRMAHELICLMRQEYESQHCNELLHPAKINIGFIPVDHTRIKPIIDCGCEKGKVTNIDKLIPDVDISGKPFMKSTSTRSL